jgi:hypothetical protein
MGPTVPAILMATDSSQGRRQFHRGRRGFDRRGPDRRGPQQQERPDRPERSEGGDQVDVGQVMREIRARIAQRHGIELTDQQVQELAARRLESILDPRTIKPALLDQLRKAAGADHTSTATEPTPPYDFSESTIYESHSSVTRALRRLLNPVLKVFFNPTPLAHALTAQARLDQELLRREVERDQRQAEWNALHYTILQRLVTEISRVSLEIQSLGLRVEALSTKVDFNERRVRSIEGSLHQGSALFPRETQPVAAASLPVAASGQPAPVEPVAAEGVGRRRRRRRRGRRSGGTTESLATTDAGMRSESPEAEEHDECGSEDVVPEAQLRATEGEARASALSESPSTMTRADSPAPQHRDEDTAAGRTDSIASPSPENEPTEK